MPSYYTIIHTTGRYDPNEVIEFDTPVFVDITKWKPLMSHRILLVWLCNSSFIITSTLLFYDSQHSAGDLRQHAPPHSADIMCTLLIPTAYLSKTHIAAC